MAENIIIKITGETDLKGTFEELQQLQDREKDIALEMRKQQQEYQKQVALIQQNVKGREAQIAAIEKLQATQAKQQKDLQQGLTQSKKSLDDFNKRFGQVNETVAKGAVSAPKFTTQLRAMKQELSEMEMAGDTTSKRFIDLSVQAGKLADQIGDTQQTIRVLSSNTRGLDTAMGLGQGLAGAFTVATSASALLGGEQEELQKAFFKVQAVMSVLNGVNEVSQMLNKNSVVLVNLRTAAENSNTISKVKNWAATLTQNAATTVQTGLESKNIIVKGASTIAQWLLNTSVLAFPAVAIIAAIAAVVGAFVLFSKSAKESKEKQEALSKSVNDTSAAIEQLKDKSKSEVDLLKATGATKEQIRAKELEAQRDAVNKSIEENKKQVEAYNAASKKEKEKLKEGLDKSAELVRENTKQLKELKQGYIIEDAQAQTDANNKAIDDAKKNEEKRKSEIESARKSLNKLVIDLMEEGKEKEIAQINLNYSEQIKAITGNSEEEIELRKRLKEKQKKELDLVNAKYADEAVKNELTLALLKAQVAEAGSAEDIVLKKATLEAQANLEKDAINKSKDTAEIKAQRILLVEAKLRKDIAAIDKTETDKQYENKLSDLKTQLDTKVITQEQYFIDVKNLAIKYGKDQKDIDKEIADNKKKLDDEDLARKEAIAQKAIEFGVMAVNLVFDAKKDKLDQEMNDLDQFYTTDAEEAKKNKDKKLISEKELAAKKLEIKRKQAEVDKAQAIFNIAIDTIQAAVGAFKTDPTGILAAIITAMGIAQGIAVASKPLPKYAKGRKGGRAERAEVGEAGGEWVYYPSSTIVDLPKGASVVPAYRKMNYETMLEYGQIPNFSSELVNKGFAIDYNRLGKAVAENVKIPSQKHVTVNVDKNGVTMSEGYQTTTFLNKKYASQWN